MAEQQEKVWVVLKCARESSKPTKVFDDRKDARAYVAAMNKHAVTCHFSYVGVKKG